MFDKKMMDWRVFMGFFIASAGIFSIVAGLIGIVILLILRKSRKIAFLLIIFGAVLYLIGAMITPPNELGHEAAIAIAETE